MSEVKETLSSSTLFHFTDERQWLEGIIEHGFIPRLSSENFSMYDLHEEGQSIGVPMVCFCDIPLSKAKYHISIYGNYGIGCSKDWCVGQGISPLVYINPTSKTTSSIKNALFFLQKSLDEKRVDFSDYQLISQGLLALIRYSKIYEGDFFHHGNIYPNKRFYDEREWRYIPEITVPDDGNKYGLTPWVLNTDDDEYHLKKSDYHDKISKIGKYKIPLDPRKINYIIVHKDEDVNPILKKLENKFEHVLTSAEMRRLLSKILTKEQIEQDF